MPNLVGIGNSQVPTNAMLGGLAYQDSAHANLTNVEIENIAAIKAKTDDTATDVFVYDTSLDADGGQWRHHCGDRSWELEELGTYDRGRRRIFPSLAVIVVTSAGIVIYDGDDPNCSMWMRINKGSTAKFMGTTTINEVVASNGILAWGHDNSGARWFDFPGDAVYLIDTGGRYGSGRIENRHSNTDYWHHKSNGTGIRNDYVNAVDLGITQWSSRDFTTGRFYPLLGTGTDNGFSIFDTDPDNPGWVYDHVDTNTAYVHNVKFLPGGDKILLAIDSGNQNKWVQILDIQHTESVENNDLTTAYNSAVSNWYNNWTSTSVQRLVTTWHWDSSRNNQNVSHTGIAMGDDRIYFSSSYGLGIASMNYYQPRMVAYVGSTYNTGYQFAEQIRSYLNEASGVTTEETVSQNAYLNDHGPLTSRIKAIGGVLKKKPVAPGAELRCYYDFANNQCFEEDAVSSHFDFGTGAWYFSIWYKITATEESEQGYKGLVYRNLTGGGLGNGFQALMMDDGRVYGYIYGATTNVAVSDSYTTADGEWHQLLFTTNGLQQRLYVDGYLSNTASTDHGSVNNTDSDCKLSLGDYRQHGSGYYWPGELALFNIGKGFPARELVNQKYKEELALFQPNAKCTLLGNMDVKDIAYDKSTRLLHVGQAGGRSEFRGLTRINKSDEAVSTSISAQKGLVVSE